MHPDKVVRVTCPVCMAEVLPENRTAHLNWHQMLTPGVEVPEPREEVQWG